MWTVKDLRQIIKKMYLWFIHFLNLIFSKKKVDNESIVVLMTFVEDVLPLIEAFYNKGYRITVIGKEEKRKYIKHLEHITYITAGNKYVFKHIQALSQAKVIIIDTYYLMLGALRKKAGQTVLQTWHASGALKNFGLTDHQVDLSNSKIVGQYKRVYDATDKYLIGGPAMSICFKESFGAKDHQFLTLGLPRLIKYKNIDIKQRQKELKSNYNIKGKVALYVPTYRENHQSNRVINKEYFEQELPNYTLLSKLHPAITDVNDSTLDIQSLLIMADVVISDYSSLAIEASYLNKPTLLYVYDEAQYEAERGLNRFYYQTPSHYKVYNEHDMIQKLKYKENTLQPIFKEWHQFNNDNSLTQIIKYIEGMVKA